MNEQQVAATLTRIDNALAGYPDQTVFGPPQTTHGYLDAPTRPRPPTPDPDETTVMYLPMSAYPLPECWKIAIAAACGSGQRHIRSPMPAARRLGWAEGSGKRCGYRLRGMGDHYAGGAARGITPLHVRGIAAALAGLGAGAQ